MTAGEKIKSARIAAKLTQSDLGKMCGTTKQTIYKYENGTITNIPIDRLELIAQATGVTAAYLTGWSDSEAAAGDELTLTEKEKGVVKCYRKATDDDRTVVDAVLKKYQENPARAVRSAG